MRSGDEVGGEEAEGGGDEGESMELFAETDDDGALDGADAEDWATPLPVDVDPFERSCVVELVELSAAEPVVKHRRLAWKLFELISIAVKRRSAPSTLCCLDKMK